MAYQNEYVLNVDIKKSTTNIVPTFVQYDNAMLTFKIYDNGSSYDLSNFKKAEITHKKPSGEIVFGQAQLINSVSNGQRVIQYRYLGSEMNETGDVQTSLSIYSRDDEKISILPFNVKIVKDLREDAAEQVQVEISLLDQIIENADDIIGQAMNASQRIKDAMQDIYASVSLLEEITREEELRQTDENARIQAEIARSQDMGNRIHRGIYSPTTQYFKHNEVHYNGSTYRCLVDSINILPTNTPNWTLVSASGTVVLENTFTSDDTNRALTAARGKELKQITTALENRITSLDSTLEDHETRIHKLEVYGGGGGTGGGTGATTNKILESICFYYGYPTSFQGTYNNDSIAEGFATFDALVWGDRVEDPTHQSNVNAKVIWEKVKAINPNCKLIGYVPIGLEPSIADSNLSIQEIGRRMDNWKALGADGIFLDEYGYDYYVTRERQNACIQMARDRGMIAFANSWDQRYVFSNESMPLTWLNNYDGNPNRIPAIIGENDYTLFENMYLKYAGTRTEGYKQMVAKSQRVADMLEFSQKPQTEFNGKSWYQHYKTKGIGLDSIVFDDPQLAREGYLMALACGIQGYAPSIASWGSGGGAYPLYEPPTIQAESLADRQPPVVESYRGNASGKVTTVVGNSTIELVWINTEDFDYHGETVPSNTAFSLILDGELPASGKAWKKPIAPPVGHQYYATDLEDTLVFRGDDLWVSSAPKEMLIQQLTADPASPAVGRIWMREDL